MGGASRGFDSMAFYEGLMGGAYNHALENPFPSMSGLKNDGTYHESFGSLANSNNPFLALADKNANYQGLQNQYASMSENAKNLWTLHQAPAGLANTAFSDTTDKVRCNLKKRWLTPQYPNQSLKGIPVMNSFRIYLDKHRDTIFTVALVFLADHYILKGALKERLRRLLEGLLTRAENSLHKELAP